MPEKTYVGQCDFCEEEKAVVDRWLRHRQYFMTVVAVCAECRELMTSYRELLGEEQ
jgi:cytidine deaminase